MTVMRALTLLALTTGAAHAASGCTSLYATVNITGQPSTIEYINTATQDPEIVFTLPATMTGVNGAALSPQSGHVYFIDRTVGNDLYAYNPNTRVATLIGAVPRPAGTYGMNIGASFDNSGASPRLYLMYGNYVIQEVSPDTGAVIRTITVTFPATDAGGNATARRTTGGNLITSGDLVFIGSAAYAIIDGVATIGGTATNVVYYAQLGALGALTGTTATVTASALKKVTSGGTNLTSGSINGVAAAPGGAVYITYQAAGTPTIATLNLGVAATAPVVGPTGGTRTYSDLSDCAVAPDAPALSKSFAPATVRPGDVSTLTLTLGNTNPTPIYTTTALTDTLPAGLVLATPPNASTTCTTPTASGPATLTAAAGAGSVTLAADSAIPAGGCTVTVSVTSASTGSRVNTIAAGGLATTAGASPAAATATLTVNGVGAAVVKTQRNVTQGGTLGTAPVAARPGDLMEYCVSATHVSSGPAATTAVLRDPLDAALSPVAGGYGAGRDVRITRDGGTTYTYATLASTFSGQNLALSILPFGSGVTVQVCFQARVR